MSTIYEYRGIKGLVAAEVLSDDGSTYSCDTPFSVAGTAKLVKDTEQSSETHYYDNGPAVVVQGEGADTVTIDVSAVPFSVIAKLTGQTYDSALGAFYEGNRVPKYFAIGYITSDTNGHDVYVWRLKGQFAIPSEEYNTKDNSASANGQQLVFTGIKTTTAFTKSNNDGAKAVIVETALEKCDVTNFFDSAQTPDTLVAKPSYTLSITQAAGTTVTVKKGGTTLADSATIYGGDQLLITVTGGTVTVDGVAFTSGDIHVVTGNTAVVSTAA